MLAKEASPWDVTCTPDRVIWARNSNFNLQV